MSALAGACSRPLSKRDRFLMEKVQDLLDDRLIMKFRQHFEQIADDDDG